MDDALASCIDKSTPLFGLAGVRALGKVVAVHDGDTLKIATRADSRICKVVCRVRGIDTPEISPPIGASGREETVRKAIMARDRLVELLTDTKVPGTRSSTMDANRRLVDVLFGGTDKYGRTLVSFPGIPVADILVMEGLANPYDGGKKKLSLDSITSRTSKEPR